MHARKNDAPNDSRLLSVEEGARYVGLGKTKFREWSESIGAVRKFGRSVRYDRSVIDRAIDMMAADQD